AAGIRLFLAHPEKSTTATISSQTERFISQNRTLAGDGKQESAQTIPPCCVFSGRRTRHCRPFAFFS
ncbi:MAG TPA: hypothetical protein PLK67_17015, partial [Bryobacteraceae bacterium]|nr:hypothetical protein [Bryobacteraceae bacterium]